jgi:hypothetical protein
MLLEYLITRFCFLVLDQLGNKGLGWEHWDGNRHLNAVHKGNANSEHGGLVVGCSLMFTGTGTGTAVAAACVLISYACWRPTT